MKIMNSLFVIFAGFLKGTNSIFKCFLFFIMCGNSILLIVRNYCPFIVLITKPFDLTL